MVDTPDEEEEDWDDTENDVTCIASCDDQTASNREEASSDGDDRGEVEGHDGFVPDREEEVLFSSSQLVLFSENSLFDEAHFFVLFFLLHVGEVAFVDETTCF